MTATLVTGFFVIRCTGLPGTYGTVEPTGRYLAAFDPNVIDPSGQFQGRATWTRDKDRAIRFASEEEARECLQATPMDAPVRLDGSPNRPLDAYKTTIDHMPGRQPPAPTGNAEADRILEEMWLAGQI